MKFTFWRVEVCTQLVFPGLDPTMGTVRSPIEIYGFATEGLARLAVDWAYANYLTLLQARPNVSILRKGSVKNTQALYCKEVSWLHDVNAPVPRNTLDHFTAQLVNCDFSVIGDMEPRWIKTCSAHADCLEHPEVGVVCLRKQTYV